MKDGTPDIAEMLIGHGLISDGCLKEQNRFSKVFGATRSQGLEIKENVFANIPAFICIDACL